MRQHIEVRDGREFTVTNLPPDRRLQLAESRKRVLWNSLTGPQKAAEIRKRKARAAKKRRRKRKVAVGEPTVTRLPDDPRLAPEQAKQRTLEKAIPRRRKRKGRGVGGTR